MAKMNQSETKSTSSLHSVQNNQSVLSRLSLSILGIVFVFTVASFTYASEEASVPILQNETTGKIIFHDDFEGYIVPDPPTRLYKPSTEKADVGSWKGGMVFDPLGALTLGIVDESRSSSGKVPAQQGKQFLMMSSHAGEPVGQAWTGKGETANSKKGDLIEANIAFYLTGESNRAFIYLYGGFLHNYLLAGFSLNGINLHHRKYTIASHDGEDFKQTSLRFEPDVWNVLTVKHINGTAEYEVSVNGGESITVSGYRSSEDSPMNAVFFNQTTDSARGSIVYFDAVGPSKEGTP